MILESISSTVDSDAESAQSSLMTSKSLSGLTLHLTVDCPSKIISHQIQQPEAPKNSNNWEDVLRDILGEMVTDQRSNNFRDVVGNESDRPIFFLTPSRKPDHRERALADERAPTIISRRNWSTRSGSDARKVTHIER